ncbi:MAG: caspase family protein [Alphaproteobacteria bacterium]
MVFYGFRGVTLDGFRIGHMTDGTKLQVGHMDESTFVIADGQSGDGPGWFVVIRSRTGEQRLYFPDNRLVGNGVLFGRAHGCDVHVDDASVSKEHCRVFLDKDKDRLRVTDLSSTNGVYIAGRRLEKKASDAFDPREGLRLGTVVLAFERVVPPPPSVPPQPVFTQPSIQSPEPDDGTMLGDDSDYGGATAPIGGIGFSIPNQPADSGGVEFGGAMLDAHFDAPIEFKRAHETGSFPGVAFPEPPSTLPRQAPQEAPRSRRSGAVTMLVVALVLAAAGGGGYVFMTQQGLIGGDNVAVETPSSAPTPSTKASPPASTVASEPMTVTAAPKSAPGNKPVVTASVSSSSVRVLAPGKRSMNKAVSERYSSIGFGNFHALVIGNDAYQHVNQLDNAIHDATAVASILANDYGFEVTLIENGSRNDTVLALDRMRARLTEKDNLLIFYAGHGHYDADMDRGYWLPVDAQPNTRANWISNADVTDSLKAIQAKHVIVVADSCYSGSLTRSSGIELPAPNLIERINSRRSRTVLASGGIEPVVDGGGKSKHSIFTTAFLDALKKNTSVLEGSALYNIVRDPVRLNAEQMPTYSDLRNANHESGGDFLFVRRDR